MGRIEAGHFEASGASVTLSFHEIPSVLMAWNETKLGTDATNVVLFWGKDQLAGDASILQNNTAGMVGVVETTNGVTQVNTATVAEVASDVKVTKTVTLALGSAFQGADSDEIHYLALFADKYTDHGDINA